MLDLNQAILLFLIWAVYGFYYAITSIKKGEAPRTKLGIFSFLFLTGPLVWMIVVEKVFNEHDFHAK